MMTRTHKSTGFFYLVRASCQLHRAFTSHWCVSRGIQGHSFIVSFSRQPKSMGDEWLCIMSRSTPGIRAQLLRQGAS